VKFDIFQYVGVDLDNFLELKSVPTLMVGGLKFLANIDSLD
jgi:hypothetical protein